MILANDAETVIQIPKGTILLPTFCDLHIHAPQFLYQGTGLDLPLMQWLDTYALKSEARMDENPNLARRVYARLATRLKEYGTGAVLLFGTLKEETKSVVYRQSRYVISDSSFQHHPRRRDAISRNQRFHREAIHGH